VAADVGRLADVQALVQQVLEQYETVDVLVNNAGALYTAADAAACGWDP
jgi:NAD(P)-dependent dehydrogenase (short-subunit alcohol dehydrogenase family)